ncbi:MAG: four helix bundle protein [Bacteroidia bacterium]|nr:four helix bundle protein [Bacteroidia bacterium]MBT8269096.1 four helix bundle protein [Bacteroidia bacterium]
MGIEKFEDIRVWNKAQELTITIYSEVNNIKDYCFKDQLTKAAISISNNIAEGFERKSNPDFARFLNYALGSTGEVRSMLYLAKNLNYLDESKTNELILKTQQISGMITRLKQSLFKKK